MLETIFTSRSTARGRHRRAGRSAALGALLEGALDPENEVRVHP
jgi:hypothetical protein